MKQKTAIVTGGAGAGSGGGSGRYIAEKLAQMGYFVAVWDIQDEAGRQVVEQIRKNGGQAMYTHCDVCETEQVEAAVREVLDRTGRVDALVNNAFWHAAIQPPLHEVTMEEWDRHININLRSHFIVCKRVIPELIRQPGSVIVNISSTGCHRGEDGYTAYGAAKAGLEFMTRSIAAQYGRAGLRCNCVVPGLLIDAPVAEELKKIPGVAEGFAMIDRHILTPGGHRDGRCVAEAVAFLVSDASGYMTGEQIVLDGGALSHCSQWADIRAAQCP